MQSNSVAAPPIDADPLGTLGLDPEQRAALIAALRAAMRGGRATLELPTRDGGPVRSITIAAAAARPVPQRDGAADATDAKLTDLLETIDEHIYAGEIRPDGRYVETFAGPGLARLLGGEPLGPSGDAYEAAIHPDDRADYAASMRRQRAGHATEIEYRLCGLDGQVRWVRERAVPRPPRPDGVIEVRGIVSDITRQRALSDELETALLEANQLNVELDLARDEADRLARTDPLTGLTNRRSFVEAAQEALAGRADDVAILMVDCDRFKSINDTRGHHVGDAVLVEVARRLRACARSMDVVGRWGGEEFIVLGRGFADDDAVREAAERLRLAVADAAIAIEGEAPQPVTISIGAARASGPTQPANLIVSADRALYAAKRRGRDRVVLVTELTDRDLEAEEPEAIRVASGLGIVAGIRAQQPELQPEHVDAVATAIARELGLDAAQTLTTRLGALLHDVGFLAVPDATRERARHGDAEAVAALAAHGPIGATLIGRVPALASAAPAVQHHEERWDGAGPGALAGDAIPLPARIIAAAVSYIGHLGRADDPRHALERVRGEAGSRLDPAVVAALGATVCAQLPHAA